MMRALLALTLLATGCPTPVCPTLATRCADAVHVEVCDSEGQWQPVADCSTLWETAGGEWTCAEADEDGERVHACLPEAP